ncbi:MaoC family dehydratase [Streptomyces sp. NPDC002952]|uniref:MaoC family dehydratase n=1 Tax=Streptomyces sp. NPDC002952 TaxID=3364673 RepID=UPI0036AAC18B
MHNRTTVLDAPPALTPLLARGAALSLLKRRPRPGVVHTPTRLTLPGVRIDLARLAAYERVCGFATGADALPVTYPHVLGFPLAMRLMAARSFPLPLLGLVHTSIEITRHQPLSTTSEYELTTYVEELTPHHRGTQAVVVTEAGTDGTVVWESRSTYLARHRTPRQAGPTPPPTAPGEQNPTSSEAGRPPVMATWRVGADTGRRYAAVSGDRNPIHLHPLTARPFGFPRAIAHGMWTVARCLAEHPSDGPVHVRAEFKAPVLLPGTVTYTSEGTSFALRGEGDRLHLTGEARDLDALPADG